MCLVEVVDGRVSKGDKLIAMSSGEAWEGGEVGLLAPEPTPTGELLTGQVRSAAVLRTLCCHAGAQAGGWLGGTAWA